MGAKKLVIFILILWVVTFLSAFMSSAAWAEVVVVTNKSVNTANLNIKHIKKIFSENQFTNYWKQMLFTGIGMMPYRISAEEMIARIKETEGAIDYVAANLAAEDVNIIRLK